MMNKVTFPQDLRAANWWLLPIILYLILSPFTPELDLSISKTFYQKETGFFKTSFLSAVYHLGPILINGCGAIAALIWIASFFNPSFLKWKKLSLTFLLTLVIGSGIIVNATLKELWGRPRPKQVVEFGGSHPFRPFYSPSLGYFGEATKSFPSGHASLGFLFFSLALAGYIEKKEKIMWTGIVLTAILGPLLAYTRVAQGGHFFSDVLGSAVVMWVSSYWICRWIYSIEDQP